MVRRRVEVQRIEDKTKRTATFSKRRNGLLKKARELAVLCDAEVAVIVFSPEGKFSCFSSHSSLEKTLQHYKRFVDAERSVSNHALQVEGQSRGLSGQEIGHNTLEIDERFSDAGSIEQLNANELTEKLESMLGQVRIRKRELQMDLVTKLHEQERTLACDKQQLQSVAGSHAEDDEESRGGGGNGNPFGDEVQRSPPSRLLQLFGGT